MLRREVLQSILAIAIGGRYSSIQPEPDPQHPLQFTFKFGKRVVQPGETVKLMCDLMVPVAATVNRAELMLYFDPKPGCRVINDSMIDGLWCRVQEFAVVKLVPRDTFHLEWTLNQTPKGETSLEIEKAVIRLYQEAA